MQQKQNCGHPLRRKGSISRVSKVTCGLLFCLTTGVFAAGENVELLTSDRIENAVPDQVGKTVTIMVQDEMGPVAGANVVVKGTTNGNISDMDGKVVLQNVPNNSTLVISFIGYTTQEVKVSNQATIHVKLVEDAKALEEVVVIGYGSLDKKQVTSAITSLKADDLMVGVSGADISASLQGKIGGLVMNNLGSANSGTTFQLRGMTSINSGKAPLIVIDGFPGGDIRSLTQDDIKSIDVLKDASAGAIYGTRAAAGVILITTKSGSDTNGKVRLTYSNEFTKKQNYNAPEMLSGREYAEHNIGTDYGSDTNWWDELINKGNFSQKHHLALEMGTEKAQVYTSFFYEKNQGIALQDERQDYGGRVNASFKLFDDWLEVRPAVDYRQAARNNHYPNFQQAMRNNPTRSPYDPDSETGYNVWINESLDYNVVADAMLEDYYGLDKWFKPEVNLKLNIKPIPGLNYQQVVGYENRQWELHQYWPSTHRSEIDNSRKGHAHLAFSKTENLTSEGYFSYVKDFKGGHNLNATAGYSYFEVNGENFGMDNYNFSVDGIKYWDIGQGSYLTDGKAGMSSGKSVTERLFSFFARANYSYQDKYMLSASIRHEGSSKFAADNRWANFWSATAGWRISNEEFMKDFDWLDDLKIRFGYGVTGNNDFSATYMANMLGSDTNWMMPNGTWAYSYGKSQNVNPNLGWEIAYKQNYGIDVQLFRELSLTVDYFREKREDVLISRGTVPEIQGVALGNLPKVNMGRIDNHGFEFEATYNKRIDKDWSFTVKGNFAYNKNTQRFMDEAQKPADYVYRYRSTGYSIGQNFGYRIDYSNGNGYINTQEELDKALATYQVGGTPRMGDFLYVDLNEDGIIDEKDQAPIKYSDIPRITYGFSGSVNWKNFDFSFLFSGIAKASRLYAGWGATEFANVGFFSDYHLQAWTPERFANGEEILYPALGSAPGTSQKPNDFFIMDRSFLRLKNIELGYTLPKGLLKKVGINSTRIYVNGNNLLTWKAMKTDVIDPEQGSDLNYPITKMVNFGINVTF